LTISLARCCFEVWEQAFLSQVLLKVIAFGTWFACTAKTSKKRSSVTGNGKINNRKINRELNNYYEQNCAVNKTNYSRTPQLVPDNSAKNLMRKI